MPDLDEDGFFNPETLSHPEPFYAIARTRRPVFETRLKGHDRRVFVVTPYALVREVFDDPERFSSKFVEVMMQGAEPHPEADALFETGVKQGSLLLNLDEPEHKRYRALVSTVFTPRQAAKLQPVMESVMDELIDAVIEKGECDFVADIAVPYPIRVICDLLGYDRSMHPNMRRWSDAFLTRIGQQQTKEQDLAAVRDILEFQAFNKSMIADRRTDPRDDLISHIVRAHVDGVAPLTDREALILLQEVGVAGNETSRNTLVGGFALLLQNPDLLARLKAEPSLIQGAVEEMLRLLSPTAGMWRIATRDTELGGVAIPAGAIVMVRIESANMDPAVFTEPARLDPVRQNRNLHLAFGHGAHYCIGNMLARRELTVGIGKLLTRLENTRILAEGTDLSRVPSILLHATKALRIAFEPGRKITHALLSGANL